MVSACVCSVRCAGRVSVMIGGYMHNVCVWCLICVVSGVWDVWCVCVSVIVDGCVASGVCMWVMVGGGM